MAKNKVFISFDFDNDRALKEFMVGQARNADSPFEISDHSLKEAAPEKDRCSPRRVEHGSALDQGHPFGPPHRAVEVDVDQLNAHRRRQDRGIDLQQLLLTCEQFLIFKPGFGL